MNLPTSSPFILYTLENPWPGMVIGGIVGFGAIWIGVGRGAKRPILVGLTALILSGLLLALTHFVETGSEALTRRTEELVSAALKGDSKAFTALLAEDARLIVGQETSKLKREEIIRRAAALPLLVQSNRIRECRGVAFSREMGESILAQTTQTAFAYPTPNEWRFRWQKGTDGEWRMTEMIWEKWGMKDVPTLGQLP